MWEWLTSTEGFVPRTHCGEWTPWLVALHTASDTVIFLAYLLIPLGFVGAYMRALVRQRPLRNSRVGLALTVCFIATCGLTHLSNRMMFILPAYNLDGVIKLVCAVASVATVLWLQWEAYVDARTS